MHLRKSYWLLPILIFSCVLFLTASIPDVSTGTWQTWNPMGDVRSGAAAVLLQDARVFIIGGTNANGPVATADLFGTDGAFSAAAAMQTPRSGHTVTVLSDGRVLVTGGTTSGGGVVNTAELYDPAANSWSGPVTMVDARAGHSASLLSDGRVLLAGGHDSAGNALSSLEMFDPASGAFSSAGAMSSSRMNHAAATLGDGRVLIIGGTADGTTALSSVDIYDPSAGSVSAGPPLSTPRMSATATTSLDGKVAVIGGNNGSTSGSQELASAEVFDPASGQFSLSASSLVTARSGHQAFLLPKNNAVLVLGGSSAGTDLNSAELYYPWADSFQSTGSMSVARPGLAGSAAGLDGRFLVAGGTGLASTELYGFSTVKTDAPDYSPGSTVTITGSGWRAGETVTLTLVESPLIDTHASLTAVADVNGNIFNNQFSPDLHDLNIRFYLTAVGSQSGLQAQNTFTDAPGDTTDTTVSCSPNPVTVNTATTCTATVKNTQSGTPNGSPQGTVNWQFNGTGTFSSSSCTLIAGGGPATSQCQVTLTPTVAANGNVKGNYNSSDNGKWKNGTSPNFGLTVTAPTDTTPPVITPNVVGTLGSNGWYTSNVAVSWTVTDPESSITSSSGCGATNITADTTGTTLTCTATSAGGTSSQSVTIKRDATPPTGVSGTASRPADHNGWYNHLVDVVFSGTDSTSGIASCTTTTYSGPDSGSASVSGTCTDSAGNISSNVNFNFKFDSTAPTAVALSVTAGTLGANGWYTSDVTVHTSGTETVSTPLNCTADQTQTTETVGQVFNGSCTNDAGLTADASALTVKLDKTGPTADLSVTAGTPGTNGWYTSDVTVHAAGTDTISSPVTCTSDQIINSETTGTPVNGTCTNNAGLTTNASALTVKLDKTAPVVTLAVTAGTAGTNGWYTSDVTIHTSGTETISNPISCAADQFQTSETTGVAFNGTCTNDAGLTGHASPLTVKLDETGPTAALAVSAGTLGDNGWYVSDVTVHASGADSISSPVACSADQFLTTDSTGHVFSGSCTNDAGLTTNAADLTVKLDKTPPTVQITPDRGADHNGWYNHALTFTNPGTDSTSGIAGCTAPVPYSGPDNVVASVSATCKDNAGNTGSGSFTFQYDATAPASVAGAPNRAADHNGWYNHAVDVAFSGNDGISGIDACSSVSYNGPDNTNASVNGTCTDKAGNTSVPVPSSPFKYDGTAPTLTGNRTPAPNAYGWNNTDVTANFSCSDSTSGVDVAPVTPQVVSAEGADQSRSASCTDAAGNSSNFSVDHISIDKTNPTITLTITLGSPAATGWYNISTGKPTVTFTCGDSLSGVASCTPPVPVGEGANQTIAGTAMDKAGNSASTSIMHVNVDVTAPTINLVSPPNNSSYVLNQLVTANYSCSDAGSSGLMAGSAGCGGTVANGSAFNTASVGSKNFTVNASDVAGNTATQTNNYNILYANGGTCYGDAGHQILQPINVSGAMSVFKIGSTVPTKFRVCDANGVSIGAPGVVTGYGLLAASNSPSITVDEDAYSTTPDTAFRWDSTGQQWIFNQSTKNNGTLNQAGTTYYFGIHLNDGSWIYFQYGLK